MKYIIIVIIVLLGGLLFINRDRFLSMSADGNTAAVVNASIPKCGEGGSYINKEGYCYCPQRKSVISYYSVCSLGNATTTPKTYELKTQRLVGDKYGVYRGSGTVTPKGGKYSEGSTAVLTATPDKDSKVVWSAEGCNTKNICKIKMDQDKEIAYAFLPKGSLKDYCHIDWISILNKEFKINCTW